MTQVDTGIRVHKPGHPLAAWERLIARLLQIAFASFVHVGTLRLVTAGGDDFTVGDGSGKPLAIRFASTAAQLAVLLDPDLRFGEGYVDGSLVVEEGSIDDVLALALSQDISSRPTRWESLQWLVRYLCRRIGQFNFRDRAQRNVAHHYDLDERLYAMFLDADRQYSCAYFESPDQTLDDAQLAKKRHLAIISLSPCFPFVTAQGGLFRMRCTGVVFRGFWSR
jgi:cyclopropane-fatty-acyl-phospholipid synthase